MPADPRAIISALFEEHFDTLLAYARRRTTDMSDAEDIVADTFVVVWRRMADMPPIEAERLPWLYGIARRIIANQRRGAGRRHRLADRLKALFFPRRQGSALASVLDALATLPGRDQEILRLVAWEGLSHAEVGLVLDISANAVAIRLLRARRRLEATMKGSRHSRTWSGWKGSVDHVESGEEVS
jgi:RNA polymerase sigma-70 factor (ECF subfamily)